MFVSGQSATAATVFSLLTFLIGVPTGVKVLNWVASLYRGSIWLRTPLLYALAFLFVFPIVDSRALRWERWGWTCRCTIPTSWWHTSTT
nr:cbb3-type cytochrome c oxidase subunit I [Rhodothermus marinus]